MAAVGYLIVLNFLLNGAKISSTNPFCILVLCYLSQNKCILPSDIVFSIKLFFYIFFRKKALCSDLVQDLLDLPICFFVQIVFDFFKNHLLPFPCSNLYFLSVNPVYSKSKKKRKALCPFRPPFHC